MLTANDHPEFDRLFDEVRRSGIKRILKRDLRQMAGTKRSGTHVNQAISFELHRRGIVHYPPAIPMSQQSLIFLAMRGSKEELLLNEFMEACIVARSPNDPGMA